MKFLLLLVTAVLGTTGLLPAASALKEIYVAVRTDGLSGSGTMSDPFNGSTEARFDAVMKSIGPNTQINLSAGTFLTHGGSAYGLQAGWKIQGSGMGVTIVKLVGFISNAQKYVQFGSWNQTDNVEIHDLTCDANYEGWKWPAHDAVGGIIIWGNNALVENVEMINCYGDTVKGFEQFSILLGGNQGGNHEIASNCTIEGCKTHQYAPGSNYTNGAGISYCINAQIINCTDDGGNHGFGFAGTSNALISGCTTTSKTARGYYTDTSTTTGLVIQGNSFSVSEIPIQFNSAGLAQNVKILNNTLTSYYSDKPGNAAIVLCGAKGRNFTITGNKYIYLGNLASGLILNNGMTFTGLDVENNSSNAGLVGWGGDGFSVDNASNRVVNNKFNLPLSSLTGGNASTGSLVNAQILAAMTTGADSAPVSTSSPALPVPVRQNGTPPVAVAASGTGASASMVSAQPSPLNVWLPPSSGISAQDKGVRSHTNLRVLDVPNTNSAALAQFNTPTMLRAVYQLPSTGGLGAIAIVDAYHFSTALADFNSFSQNFGLPKETSASAVSTGNRTFQVVYAAGYPAISGGDYIASWNLEAALDIEWAHAMAPNAKIYLVEALSDSTSDLDYAVRVASRLPGVKEVSMSWGGNEVPWEVWNYDPIFTTPGVVYLASSGDSSDQTEYPAASPNVISCGGTSINRNASGAFVSETGWNTAGCGPSAFEPRPSYQIRIASLVGVRRGVSDVAFDADPSTGVYVYDSTPLWGESGWWILGGTSVSSPALAGVLNLAASYGNGFAMNTAQEQGRLYANLGNANAFRDVTSGIDGRLSCRVGWDFVTGVGSPNGLVGK